MFDCMITHLFLQQKLSVYSVLDIRATWGTVETKRPAHRAEVVIGESSKPVHRHVI